MSPELIDPGSFGSESRPTKELDCYALGMVIYEVLSGQMPFAPFATPTVIYKVLNGQRPERPEGDEGRLFTTAIWEVLELCWKHQPDKRTGAKEVLECLEGTPPRPSSDVEETVYSDTDEQSDATASDSGAFSPFRLRPQDHL